MTNEELEERGYYEAWLVARDHSYPYDFKAFCADFDHMILQAQLQNRLDNMEVENE